MNRMIRNSAWLLIVAASVHNIAMADPVNINITGRVVASPCIVNNNNSNLDVNLGNDIEASTLATAGAATPAKAFDLKLTSCPVGTTSVTVTFTGSAAASPQTDMYVNTGVATPLAVELSSGGTVLPHNSSLTQPVLADKTVTYALSARAVTATGSVLPGSINAVVTANFTYN